MRFRWNATFPVRDHLPLVGIDIFLGDSVTLQLPRYSIYASPPRYGR